MFRVLYKSRRSAVFVFMELLALVLLAARPAHACTSDSQCKAGRVCSAAGRCVAPPAAPAASTPAASTPAGSTPAASVPAASVSPTASGDLEPLKAAARPEEPADKVTLKSGATLKGDLGETTSDSVVINVRGGSTQKLPWDQIVEAKRRDGTVVARPSPPPPPAPPTPPAEEVCKTGRVLYLGACRDPAEISATGTLIVPRSPDAPAASQSEPTAAPAEATHTELRPVGAGLGLTVSKTLDSDAVRRHWLTRGGVIFNGALNANLTGLYQSIGGATIKGGGGGLGFRLGMLFLSAPDPQKGAGLFGFRIGTGLDASAMVISVSEGAFGSQSMEQGSLAIPVYVGFQFGGGSFNASGEWHGFTAGISWTPSYYIPITQNGVQDGSLNLAGATLELSPATLNSLAPEAHFKLDIFVLPPIGDLPLLVNIGFGAVWY